MNEEDQEKVRRDLLPDECVLSGIIFINCNGLRWRDAPEAYGPHKTLCSRWKRWSEKGIFARMMAGFAAGHAEEKTVMIDVTYRERLIERRPAWPPKRGRGRLIGRTKGGMNTKLHAICDSHGRPPDLFITAGQVSDDIVRGHCSAACRTSNGCSGIAATTPTGFEKP